jgi:hypothetical protein
VNVKQLANIDWNALKRLTSPQGVKDFDAFLDGLPLKAGTNALIAAGIAWIVAGTAVFFTTMEIEKVGNLRAELAKVGALKPTVPVITYDPVPETQLVPLEKRTVETYKGIAFAGTASALTLTAGDTDYFPQFLAAINTLQNGGRNWRVSLTSLCAGADCTSSRLSAVLKVEMARVDDPPKEPTAPPG